MGCVIGRIHYGLKVVFCLNILLPTIIIILQDCSQLLKICKCLWGLSCEGVSNMLLVLSLHHFLSLIEYIFQENRNLVSIIIVQFIMSANIRIRFGLQIVFVCLYIAPSHYHHCANFLKTMKYKMPFRYVLSSVWVRISKFSQLSIIYNIWACVSSFCPFPLWWLRESKLCLIITIKLAVWIIIHF